MANWGHNPLWLFILGHNLDGATCNCGGTLCVSAELCFSLDNGEIGCFLAAMVVIDYLVTLKHVINYMCI